MNKKINALGRNLSLFTHLAIYITIAIILIFLETFQWDTQWNVLSTFIPFFIMGAILDYLVSKDHELQIGYRIFVQLMPTGVFLLYGFSLIIDIIERPPVVAFSYLIWLFIAVPFFIVSNIKNNYRRRMLSSIIGTGLVGAVYIHLTTMTDELDTGNGLIVYLICIFLMFYAASKLKRLFFIGAAFGLIDGAVLIFLWKNPITEASTLHSWDFDIAYQFELLLLANFIICIIICLVAAFTRGKTEKKNNQ